MSMHLGWMCVYACAVLVLVRTAIHGIPFEHLRALRLGQGYNPRPHRSGLRSALILPCTRAHFEIHLELSLLQYMEGTVWPDEVIVSVSEAEALDPWLLASLRERYSQLFARFVIITFEGPRSSGFNRQAASELAEADILVYADADDPAHPQRLDVLLAHFALRAADELVMVHHRWTCNASTFRRLDTSAARLLDKGGYLSAGELLAAHANASFKSGLAEPDGVSPAEMLQTMPVYASTLGARGAYVLTGQPAIRRSVLSAVQWPDWHGGEDKVFSWTVVARLGRSIVIFDELACYSSLHQCWCPITLHAWPPVHGYSSHWAVGFPRLARGIAGEASDPPKP